MSDRFRQWSREVRTLHDALDNLAGQAVALGLSTPHGQPWHDLLTRKLAAQLDLPPALICAVVGGTNIGKSAVFNQLAGEEASAVSPLAAGTKHPVCLLPADFPADQATLARLFPGFELCPWQAADEALADTPADRLFFRTGANCPPRLVLLDTPDIDSDARVNWTRADHIRETSDVLIAVLTQQKYNDAAVKQFFRQAVAADKPVIVVFNQCDLAADRDFWPAWLATFCEATGAQPESVYVAPYDRAASLSLNLPFYDVGPDGRQPPTEPRSIRRDLADLRFDAIKLRTLRGALVQVTEPAVGAPQYLGQLRLAAREFAVATETLSASEMTRVHWPALPARILVEEIRAWWDQRRSPLAQRIHGAYRWLGTQAFKPVQAAWRNLAGGGELPPDDFTARELDAILMAVGRLIDELDRLSRIGNHTLRPRLEARLRGAARAELLEHVQQAHAELPAIDEDYRRFLRDQLDHWSQANPRAVAFLRSLDHVLAFARPAITVTLFVSGGLVAGSVVHEAAVQAAGHTAGQLATEAAITGGIAVGGEALVETTGHGLRQAAGQLFRTLQDRYAQSRAKWLAEWIERELLGDLLAELRRGADLATCPALRQAEQSLAALRAELR